MIKYLPATIRYFINFYRNVTFFLLFCIIYQKHSPSSPSASTFSQFTVVLPSLPFPVSSNKHSKPFTIPMLQYIKNTHNKGIKNQKAKLRSYFLLFSGSLSVSYASFTATNRSYPSFPLSTTHLRVLFAALIGMQSQRESFVGLSDVFLGGASIHAQHRVQVWTHRSPPRLPSAGRRGRKDRCRSK